MRFSLDAANIVFANERKYPVEIADGETITIKVPVFDAGTPEAVLQWRKQFKELADIKGLTAAQKFTNVLLLLSGEAKEYWIDSRDNTMDAAAIAAPTNDHFSEVMTAFMSKYFSTDAAADLREFLLNAKKPSTMDFQTFLRRIKELNRYLPYLPPPMNDVLTDDELFMIVKKAVPSWHKIFITTGQRQHVTTLQELSDYFLGIEEVEKHERSRNGANNSNRNRSPSSSNPNSQNHDNNDGSQGNGRRNNQNSNNSNSTRRNARNYCHRHETDRHSWYDCRLNPRSANYDPNQPPPRSERNQDNNHDTASTTNSQRSQTRHNNNGNSQSNQRDARNIDNSNRPRHNYNTRSNTRSNEGHYNIQERPQRATANRYTSIHDDDDDDDSLYAMEEKIVSQDPKSILSITEDTIPELRFTLANPVNPGREPLRMLLDTGASRSIINYHCLPEGTKILPDPQGTRTFTTQTGTFSTDTIAHLKIQLPDVAPQYHVQATFSIHKTTNPKATYAAILGRDMLRQLKIQFDFTSLPPMIMLHDFSLPMTSPAKQFSQTDSVLTPAKPEISPDPTFQPPNAKSLVINETPPIISQNAVPASLPPAFIQPDLIFPVIDNIKHHVPPRHADTPSTTHTIPPLILSTTTGPNSNPASTPMPNHAPLANLPPTTILQLSTDTTIVYPAPMHNPAHHPFSCSNILQLPINGTVLLRLVNAAQCSLVAFPSSPAAVEDATVVS
jgi:Retroviral aspartyl protease